MRQKVIREKYDFWSGHHRDRTAEVGGREHLWRVEGSGSVLWMVSHRGFLIIGVEGAKKCFDSRILKNHSKRSWRYNTFMQDMTGACMKEVAVLVDKREDSKLFGNLLILYVCVCLYTHTHTHTEGKDEPRFGACVMLWASWFCGKRCCSVFSHVQFEELAENSARDMWEMEWNRDSCSGECSGNGGMEIFCLMATETLLGRGKLFKD